MYNEKVTEIFANPKNVGELKDANAVGQVGNAACGDIMKLYLKIKVCLSILHKLTRPNPRTLATKTHEINFSNQHPTKPSLLHEI